MEYVSVIGVGVTGSFSGNKGMGLTDRFESIVAQSSYTVLSGEGEGMLGDGKILYLYAISYYYLDPKPFPLTWGYAIINNDTIVLLQ